jgi:hypothetical protein
MDGLTEMPRRNEFAYFLFGKRIIKQKLESINANIRFQTFSDNLSIYNSYHQLEPVSIPGAIAQEPPHGRTIS